MKEHKSNYVFYAVGLKDLRNTIKVISNKHSKISSTATLGKHLKNGTLLRQNIFGNTTMEIRETKDTIEVDKEIEYTSSFHFTHKIKLTKTEF
jgi:hypothetical protein